MFNFDGITELLKSNQFLVAGLGLSGAGIISFWLRDFPRMIFTNLKREFTTELTVTNQNIIFYDILRWIEIKFKDKNFRQLKVNSSSWGREATTITSVGYGFHIIKFNGRRLLLVLSKESANQTNKDKESITITKFGRSRKLFDTLITEIDEFGATKDNKITRIYKMSDGWDYVRDQPKRHLESIFIEQKKKDLLTSRLTKFIKSEQWYIDKGIPYQFGILLYGEPGTGKTSLIKAIAAYLDYPIYYLSPQKLFRIEVAMADLPCHCIILIEDIDTSFLTHSRSNKRHNENDALRLSKKSDNSNDSISEELASASLSEVLNSIDGMFSAHGRILIATTNHIEKLDPALIRPGRIDIQLEVGFVNKEIFKQFLDNFYPDHKVDLDGIYISRNISVASLQNMVLEGKSVQEVVHYVYKGL